MLQGSAINWWLIVDLQLRAGRRLSRGSAHPVEELIFPCDPAVVFYRGPRADLGSERRLTPAVRGIGGASLVADLRHEVPASLLLSLLTLNLRCTGGRCWVDQGWSMWLV